jgi:glutaminyl-tRNA synthetase
LTTLAHCKLEPSLANADLDTHYQFERLGYFVKDNTADSLVFNRTVTLRDTWAKIDQANA